MIYNIIAEFTALDDSRLTNTFVAFAVKVERDTGSRFLQACGFVPLEMLLFAVRWEELESAERT